MKDDTIEYLRSAAERLAIRVAHAANFESPKDVLYHAGYDGCQVEEIEESGLLDYYAVHLVLQEGVRSDVFVEDAFPLWDDIV